MPYINEFASGESLWSLSDSQSVRDFQGTIRFQEGNVHHDPPPTLDAARGTGLIKRIIAIDGSTVTKTVQNGYPGAEAALFNLAAIVIELDKLRRIPLDYIPGPKEMRDLERSQTLSAVLPGRNIVRAKLPQDTPKRYFRATIASELDAKLDPDHETILDTFRRITAQRTSATIQCPVDECPLQSPNNRVAPAAQSTCACQLKETIFETDSLRAHERFEDSGSSEEAFSAFRAVAEQLVLVNILRHFERTETLEILRDTAFVMDGPLAIFGMPAWLKTYVGNEIARIHNNCQQRGDPGILLMGVEKSGDFLEHLKMLDWEPGAGSGSNLPNGTAYAPDLKYIHQHIKPRPENAKPYGQDTYYGRRVLFKNKVGQHTVVMMPVVNSEGDDPNCVSLGAFPRIGEALDILDELATHLYQDAFAPLVRAHAHAAIPLKAGERIIDQLFANA